MISDVSFPLVLDCVNLKKIIEELKLDYVTYDWLCYLKMGFVRPLLDCVRFMLDIVRPMLDAVSCWMLLLIMLFIRYVLDFVRPMLDCYL